MSVMVRRNCYDVTLGMTQGAAGADTTTGLISYWPIDEGTGTTISDDQSGHNGTGTALFWVGTLYTFVTGADTSPIQITDHADFAPGSTITVFGWAKVAVGDADGRCILAQYDSAAGQRAWFMGLSLNSPFNKLRVVISDDGTTGSGHFKDYEGSQVCADATNFYSVAFRFNAGTLDLFVNGVKDTSVTQTTPGAGVVTVHNSTANLCIGSFLSGGVVQGLQTVTGPITDARFYNVAKTDADILAIHNLGHHS